MRLHILRRTEFRQWRMLLTYMEPDLFRKQFDILLWCGNLRLLQQHSLSAGRAGSRNGERAAEVGDRQFCLHNPTLRRIGVVIM